MYKAISFYSHLILILSFAVGCTQKSHKAEIQKPNIIYILADDLGYADLGSYGQENIKTPNLDRMAEEGLRFTQHYSGSTVCAPARSVLMTGLHSGHAPVRGNREHKPIGQAPFPYAVPTIAEVLQETGYTTGAFGKWGLGYPGSESTPSLQGFDIFFGFNGQRRAHFYYPEFLFLEKKGEEPIRVPLEGNRVENTSTEDFPHPGSGPPISAEIYAPEAIHERALSFIEENREQSFFLYYPSQIPHASLEVPEEYLEMYLDENGESIFEEEPTPQNHYVYTDKPAATYAAMVSYLDYQVGEILDRLEELQIAENTLVIFTSDNGSYSEGGYHYSMLNSNGDLRGGKRDLYEGGIRVPMIAWWPGRISVGQTSDHISAFQDIMPTFAELAGTNTPPGVDGISFVPELFGTGNQESHEYLYWEFPARGGKQAIRKGDWKAVRLDVRENRKAPIELYNLELDLGEENNIAEQHPDVVAKMDSIFQVEHVPSETFPLFNE
ncbi:MAG: arylsulfatase [Balneolaceae bacterium]|nr:arylsulfatase [Balneolaceae bacterium]